MDTQMFETAGKVGGVAGLAIATVMLVFRDAIRQKIFPKLPAREAFQLQRLIIIATATVGVLGIFAWAANGNRSATSTITQQTLGAGSPAIAHAGSVSIGPPLGAGQQRLPDDDKKPSSAAPEQGGTKQITGGSCSPAIAYAGKVVINCGLTKEALFRTATDNLEACDRELRALLATQIYYLMPSIDEYVNASGADKVAKWRNVIQDVSATTQRLRAAVQSVTDYDVSLEDSVSNGMPELHSLLHAKGESLAELPLDPPDKAFVDQWTSNFKKKILMLSVEVDRLKHQIHPPAASVTSVAAREPSAHRS